jgi:hypothetical protein
MLTVNTTPRCADSEGFLQHGGIESYTPQLI